MLVGYLHVQADKPWYNYYICTYKIEYGVYRSFYIKL